jgi:hypothetical protein
MNPHAHATLCWPLVRTILTSRDGACGPFDFLAKIQSKLHVMSFLTIIYFPLSTFHTTLEPPILGRWER